MGRDFLGEFEHQVLLAILQHGGESYSVPVVTELEVRAGREVAQAAVFIVLRRLEEKGLVRSRLSEGDEETGRTRRYFRITPAGMMRLRESRRALLRLWEGVDAALDGSG
ncbi:MAG: PadR family transcriptional regulator [Gemmatimonadetes bacterium]|nr:PadR family transcriptional regulator [Gemmatimonadota bacterium]